MGEAAEIERMNGLEVDRSLSEVEISNDVDSRAKVVHEN